MNLTKMQDKSIGEQYLHNLCPECKEKIEKEMDKVNKSKFPLLKMTKLMTTLHNKLCKKCKLAVYNQARTDKNVRNFNK